MDRYYENISCFLHDVFLKFYRNLVVSSVHGSLPSIHDGFIIISGHKCGADPVILQAALDLYIHFIVDAQFFIKKSSDFFFSNFIGGLPGSTKYPLISVRGVREAIEKLKKGKIVGIFPEGIMIRDPYKIGKFKYGAAYLSMKTNKPVIPIYLKNIIPGPLPPNPNKCELGFEGFCSIFYNIGNRVDIFVGEPIFPDVLKITKKNIVSFTERIRRNFLNLIPGFN